MIFYVPLVGRKYCMCHLEWHKRFFPFIFYVSLVRGNKTQEITFVSPFNNILHKHTHTQTPAATNNSHSTINYLNAFISRTMLPKKIKNSYNNGRNATGGRCDIAFKKGFLLLTTKLGRRSSRLFQNSFRYCLHLRWVMWWCVICNWHLCSQDFSFKTFT